MNQVRGGAVPPSVTMAEGCRQGRAMQGRAEGCRWQGCEFGMGMCGKRKQGKAGQNEEFPPSGTARSCAPPFAPPCLPPLPHLQPVGEDDVGVHGGDVEVVDEGTLLPGGEMGGREGRV